LASSSPEVGNTTPSTGKPDLSLAGFVSRPSRLLPRSGAYPVPLRQGHEPSSFWRIFHPVGIFNPSLPPCPQARASHPALPTAVGNGPCDRQGTDIGQSRRESSIGGSSVDGGQKRHSRGSNASVFRYLHPIPPVRLGRFLSEQVNAELEREAKEKYAESMNGAVQRK
jgi:hypothetical protein